MVSVMNDIMSNEGNTVNFIYQGFPVAAEKLQKHQKRFGIPSKDSFYSNPHDHISFERVIRLSHLEADLTSSPPKTANMDPTAGQCESLTAAIQWTHVQAPNNNSFPFLCAICERQMVSPSNSVMYCSDACRQRGMNKPVLSPALESTRARRIEQKSSKDVSEVVRASSVASRGRQEFRPDSHYRIRSTSSMKSHKMHRDQSLHRDDVSPMFIDNQ